MNQFEALSIVRALAQDSGRCGERRSKAALAVLDKKIQSLARKQAWRICPPGEMPPHMIDPSHPLNKGRRFEVPLKPAPEPGDLIPMWSAKACEAP